MGEGRPQAVVCRPAEKRSATRVPPPGRGVIPWVSPEHSRSKNHGDVDEAQAMVEPPTP